MDYGIPLKILSYQELYGWTMDKIVTQIGLKNNCSSLHLPVHERRAMFGSFLFEPLAESCIFLHLQTGTFCGVFRRQALDRGACLMGADKIATGHNADDIAESVLLNFLRGDISRLGRCVSIITGEDGPLPRSKPFKYTYEKEIVLYAYFKKLVYFSTECIYAPNSYRGHAREYLKNLEASNPQTIISASALV
jgi:cytoplasmic tRNA 2-thiolation protein 1